MQLIEDLLDDARLRDGSLILHFELCDLNAIVCQAVEEQRVLSADRATPRIPGTRYAVPRRHEVLSTICLQFVDAVIAASMAYELP